mgnify:FL=1
MYTLFQRDRADAPEPMSMLYYDPQVSGDFWFDLDLDHHFDNVANGWASMRSSWTTTEGMYVAIKSGGLQGHQAHGDLDAGTFLIDALGQRWAGELGNGNYLATGYFSPEGQNDQRWLYYRKRTEGQNTLLMGGQNQNVEGIPTTTFQTTGEKQDALVYTPANSSTAFFTTDMTEMYNGTCVGSLLVWAGAFADISLRAQEHQARHSVRQRPQAGSPPGRDGRSRCRSPMVRLPALPPPPLADTIPRRRMHTNATITLSNNDRTATLALGGETLIAEILTPAGATFGTAAAVRLATDPPTPTADPAMDADQPNPGVTVLTIGLAEGAATLQVLFKCVPPLTSRWAWN